MRSRGLRASFLSRFQPQEASQSTQERRCPGSSIARRRMKCRSLSDRHLYLDFTFTFRVSFLIPLFEISTVAFSQHSEFRLGLDESLFYSTMLAASRLPRVSRSHRGVFRRSHRVTSTPFLGRVNLPTCISMQSAIVWIYSLFITSSDCLWSMGRYPGLHRTRPSLYLLIS